jgi:hypothetical protein
MNTRVWVVVMVICACDPQRSRETAALPVKACQPVVHQTTGPLTTTYFEQYRFVGGSSDGKRVAVEHGNVGPGAGVPVIALLVIEAGTTELPFRKSYFVQDGTGDQMASLMERLASEHGDEVTAAAVTPGHDAPSPIAWCADPAGKIHTVDGVTLELQVTHDVCAKNPAKRSLGWKLCVPGGACITDAAARCVDGSATFLDLYKAGGYTWAVVDLVIERMTGMPLHEPAIAGAAL